MTYRNGRFINNMFVPADATPALPAETVVSSEGSKSARAGKMMADDSQVSTLNQEPILQLFNLHHNIAS
jgi:type IV secretory pathway VirB9-like protein